MRLLLAFLLDSFKEATHTKLFHILMFLIGGFLLVLLSIGYKSDPATEAFQQMLKKFGMSPQVKEVKELGSEGWMTRFEVVVELDQPRSYMEWLALARAEHWKFDEEPFSEPRARLEGDGDSLKAIGELVQIGSSKVVHSFVIDRSSVDAHLGPVLERSLSMATIRDPKVELVSSEGWNRTIRITGSASSFHMSGGTEVSILFGLWTFRPSIPFGAGMRFGTALFVFFLQLGIFEWIACFGAVVMALIVTSGMVPNMLRKGTVEFWVSQPVGRVRIVLFRFLGGLVFILPPAILLLGGSFLILSLRSGYWNWWFLMSLPIFVLYYAVLHSLSVLFGMLTRSTIAAILLTALIWTVSGLVYWVKEVVHTPQFELGKGAVVIVDTLSWVFPRTAEAGGITNNFMFKGMMKGTDLAAAGQEAAQSFSMTETVFHCLGYMFVCLALTALIFVRRDL
jgi:ABC-type transport system involved in multi-copper enzyme maturation permease subunit